jgi:hypothetical protein
MSGTVEGGIKTAKTVKELYGKDYFARIGALGGKKGKTGGFYQNRELARTAGAIGGARSRRRKHA